MDMGVDPDFQEFSKRREYRKATAISQGMRGIVGEQNEKALGLARTVFFMSEWGCRLVVPDGDSFSDPCSV